MPLSVCGKHSKYPKKRMEQYFQDVGQKIQHNKNSNTFTAHFAQYFNQNLTPQQCCEIMKIEILSKVNPIGSIKTWSKYSCNVKHPFMALKRVAKLNGYHSLTVWQKYKSRYWLEIRHWHISCDYINFSYWHTVAPALNLKSISPPVIPRISYKVGKMVIILSWTKLPFQFSQNWFLLKLSALKRCEFKCLKLTYEILANIISNFIARMYCIFWELSDHMFSFSQKFKLE